MSDNPADQNLKNPPDVDPSPNDGGSRTRRDLIVWLALLPVILGLLLLCGQAALLFSLKQSAADTQSRLKTSYGAWVYDLIPPINIPQLIEDIQEDLRAEGASEEPAPVVTGVFFVPPTATPLSVANATLIPEMPSATPLPPKPTATWVIVTSTKPPDTKPKATSTAIVPTAVPSATNTLPPPPTKAPTNTATVFVPTSTATQVPTATFTYVPPPTAVPYQPISPRAENGGASVPDGKGCKATFGYKNDNAYPVSIPLGPRNQLNIDSSSSPPTSFAVGRSTGSFQVTWTTGGSVIWSLDGSRAEVHWCNP